MKRSLHAPQPRYSPHDLLDQAVIEIRQLNDELLESLNLPVEDRATITHRLQLPWRKGLLARAEQIKKYRDKINGRNAGRKGRARVAS
ncbi:hypothetical protein [Bradyrhizobium iriomotense]|uniref:hypothetical protein n=1 Tax=Bradyrhizobium iriomotense TaxID=441950 RepID=UPI001B89E0A1|nr:hypothetical protein [Bradyrhizobium iriomotense]MBR0786785.1 hypothetical protein [Bradyrhizobium iriomotense]